MLLFVDESGHDRRDSPYAVLAGLAVEESQLWPLIQAIHKSVDENFGIPYDQMPKELKGSRQLTRKAYRQAQWAPVLGQRDRARRSLAMLRKREEGKDPERGEIAAYRQAGLAFVADLFRLCDEYGVRAFASIVDRDAPRLENEDFLRKDYSYLFERFFHFVREQTAHHQGLIVFDELERSQCQILTDQMRRYFLETSRGRDRAKHIIPEPFFVHSDLTTMIQAADFAAYVTAWGVTIPNMTRDRRSELMRLADALLELRYKSSTIGDDGNRYDVWGFKYIDDLRPRRRHAETV